MAERKRALPVGRGPPAKINEPNVGTGGAQRRGRNKTILGVSTETQNKTKGTAQILTAGAVAGSAQAAVLHSSRGMLSAATRAAPIHAMVFYAYESMKEGMQRR